MAKVSFLAKSAFGTALVIGAALVSFAPAATASTYNFDGFALLPSVIVVNLDITTGGPEGAGSVAITAVTGTVGGDAVTLLGSAVAPPGSATSPDGEWIYDNVLYPALNSPYGTAFDNPGLLLLNTVTDTEINIFSPGVAVAPYTLGQSPGQQQEDLFGVLTATPLPQTFALVSGGLGLIGFMTCRKRKTRGPSRLEVAS